MPGRDRLKTMMRILSRHSRYAVLLTLAFALAAGSAEARIGGGRSSFGSRGTRTWSAPAPTTTAPGQASPFQRSQTPTFGTPGYAAPGGGILAPQPRRFGFGTGLAAGLFGAGLLGLLTGNGFFGGLAGIGSVLGLLFQIVLVIWLGSLVLRWFRRRSQPTYAQAYAGPSPLGGSGSGAGLYGSQAVRDEIGIGQRDYADFERMLVEMQAAYSRGDITILRQLATPEMATYIQDELDSYADRGLVNTVSHTRLLQGDLAEAWREGPVQYATVAMRYAMIDVTRETATGRVVEGDPLQMVEATEIWTFRRDSGDAWKLSAIQQSH